MARLTTEATKWIEIPNDTDKSRVKIKIMKPGAQRRLELKGTSITGTVGDTDDQQYHVSDLHQRKINWMEEVFIEWENFLDVKKKPVSLNQDSIFFFQEELLIDYPVEVTLPPTEEGKEPTVIKETVSGTLYDWAMNEYEKFSKEHEEQRPVAEKN